MIRISAAVASVVPERETGDHREDEPAGHVDHAVDEVGDVFGVVAEVGDRRAGRTDGLTRVETAARHLGAEHVRPQQRLHVDPRLGPDERAVVDRHHANRLAHCDGAAHHSVSSVLPASSELYPCPRKYPVTAGIMKKTTNSDHPHQNSRGAMLRDAPGELPDVLGLDSERGRCPVRGGGGRGETRVGVGVGIRRRGHDVTADPMCSGCSPSVSFSWSSEMVSSWANRLSSSPTRSTRGSVLDDAATVEHDDLVDRAKRRQTVARSPASCDPA